MLRYDTRNFSNSQREALAWKAHEYKDFALPPLTAWNYALCRKHRNGWVEQDFNEAGEVTAERTVYDRPMPGCRQCGIHFRKHQRVSIMWLYLKKRALLADTMGTGKTTSAAGLIALLLETGELPEVGRVVIVPRAPALYQWREELLRMIPGLDIAMAEGTKRKRMETYSSEWQVLLIGPEMLRQKDDFAALRHIPLAALICDDIDPLRNPDTETSYTLDKLGEQADRYVIMSGTPLQKRLPELHAVLDGIGGLGALGGLDAFTRRYVRSEWVVDHDRSGREFKRQQIVGYQNLDELKRKMAPLVLRRTADDLDDVDLPAIQPEDVFLSLYPSQRAKYDELRQGVIRIMKEQGTEVKHTTALSRIHYGAAICAGLAALGEPDGPRTSVKLDWIESKLMDGGDLEDEKVVIFARLKNSVRALQARLTARGIGFETVWGDEPDKRKRHASQQRFWEDPACRVMIGTSAMEQSLNLQVSRHLINADMILNPARMAQLAGRIRRDGSAYRTVYVHNLLTHDTQEARYLAVLEREAALASHIWDETDELFRSLSSTELLRLITG
jgi:SNF2 family DNA or RNA helicase